MEKPHESLLEAPEEMFRMDQVTPTRPSFLRFLLTAHGISPHARLLWDEAPQTCAAVLCLLRSDGLATKATLSHGTMSGSEVQVTLPAQFARAGKDNHCLEVAPLDVGIRDNVISIFYHSEAKPMTWTPDSGIAPAPIAIFARFEDDNLETLIRVCFGTREHGSTTTFITPMQTLRPYGGHGH